MLSRFVSCKLIFIPQEFLRTAPPESQEKLLESDVCIVSTEMYSTNVITSSISRTHEKQFYILNVLPGTSKRMSVPPWNPPQRLVPRLWPARQTYQSLWRAPLVRSSMADFAFAYFFDY